MGRFRLFDTTFSGLPELEGMELNLELSSTLPLNGLLAGMQISRGTGRHMDRIIDCFDLLFVREGVVPIQEEDQAFEVMAGQTLLLWPGRRHFGTSDFSHDLRLYWLHFNLNEPYYSGSNLDPAEFNFMQPLSVPQYVTVARPEVLELLFRRFLDDQETGRLVPTSASLLAMLMLTEIADQRPLQSIDRTAAALAARALAYIRGHLHVPLTVSQVAKELGYNPDYLNRVFHQTYHHTLTEEIHLSRIGYARYLLLYSSKNVEEIATASGFPDAGYFSRLFKRYEGVTPMAFRRINAQTNVNFE